MAVDLNEQVDEYGRAVLPESETVSPGTVTSFAFEDSPGIDGTVTDPSGAVSLSLALTAEAVGLENVDNTSDLDKPVSTAVQGALDTAEGGIQTQLDSKQATIDSVGAVVTAAAAQAIPHNTLSNLQFDTEVTDTGACHSNTTNPGRLTAPVAGFYVVTATVSFATNSTGRRLLILLANGTTELARSENSPEGASEASALCVSAVVYLAVSDYVEAQVFQTSGIGLNAGITGVMPRLAFVRMI